MNRLCTAGCAWMFWSSPAGKTLLAIVAISWGMHQVANADLRHRYSFTSDASDSVGGAHGTVIDAGTMPNHVFADGQLDVSANTGNASNNITEDAYVDLPNGIISSLYQDVRAASYEIWFTVDTHRTWTQAWSFGNSNTGEDMSPGGQDTLWSSLYSQAGPGDMWTVTHPPAGGDMAAESGIVLPTGVKHHVVSVHDHNDTSAGPNGTVNMYLNGQLVATQALHENVALETFDDVNNWLGRAQWPDPLFDGSYDEFRIYDHAQDAEAVGFNFVLGPDVYLEPQPLVSLEANTTTGQVKLINNVDVDLDLNYYEILSPAGALNPTGWNSLDDQEAGDPPGQGWDESGGSNANQLIELFLAVEGQTLSGMSELSLGSAFDPSVFGPGVDGDLTIQFGLAGGALLDGIVNFVGGGDGVTGDYNGDGFVNAADYTLWRDNEGTSNPLLNDAIGGEIGAAHYQQWIDNFGNSLGAGSAVPEPTALVMLLGALSLAGGKFIGTRSFRASRYRSCSRA